MDEGGRCLLDYVGGHGMLGQVWGLTGVLSFRICCVSGRCSPGSAFNFAEQGVMSLV